MVTINTIGHAIKVIIRLTETLRTSLLTLPNSIYIGNKGVVINIVLGAIRNDVTQVGRGFITL